MCAVMVGRYKVIFMSSIYLPLPIFSFSCSMLTKMRMLKGVLLLFLIVVPITQPIVVQDFKFSLFPRIKISTESASPKLAKLKKMEVASIDSNLKIDMNLIQFLFQKMDFNYLHTVPKSEKLTFKMPDI